MITLDIIKIKKLMISKNMSNHDLAEKMEVPDSRVSKILNQQSKRNRFQTVYNLAKALDCEIDEILKEA